jgi:hypothetical protein
MDTIVHNRQNSEIGKEMGVGVGEDTITREVVKESIVLVNCCISSQALEEIMMLLNTGDIK